MNIEEINKKLKMTKEEIDLISSFRKNPNDFSIKKQMEVEYNKTIDEIKRDQSQNAIKYKKILNILYILALFGLFMFYIFFPNLVESEVQTLKTFPNDLEKLKESVQILRKYSNENFYYIYFLFIYLFLTLQSLGIIDCGILVVLSGALFSFWTAIITVTVCLTIGASVCYLLSRSLFSGYLIKHQEKKLAELSYEIKQNRNNLLLFFVSLRFSPIFSNRFINLASSIVGIPLDTFFVGTVLGLIPLSLVYIKTGLILNSISEVGIHSSEIGFILMILVIVVFPSMLKKNDKKKSNINGIKKSKEKEMENKQEKIKNKEEMINQMKYKKEQ